MTHRAERSFKLGGIPATRPPVAISLKLSRSLHDTLGEDAATDLVNWMHTVDDHRAELRELNELTVARIEARIGQVEARIGQVEARIDGDLRAGLARLEGKIDQRFGDLIKWSFLFWCGAVAAAILARR